MASVEGEMTKPRKVSVDCLVALRHGKQRLDVMEAGLMIECHQRHLCSPMTLIVRDRASMSVMGVICYGQAQNNRAKHKENKVLKALPKTIFTLDLIQY